MTKKKKKHKTPYREFNNDLPKVHITADASCSIQHNLSAYAVEIVFYHKNGTEKEYRLCEYSQKLTDSSQVEFLAIVRGLEWLSTKHKYPCNVKIFTDSQHAKHVVDNLGLFMSTRGKKSPDSLKQTVIFSLLKRFYTQYQRHNIISVKKIPRNSTDRHQWCDDTAGKMLQAGKQLLIKQAMQKKLQKN